MQLARCGYRTAVVFRGSDPRPAGSWTPSPWTRTRARCPRGSPPGASWRRRTPCGARASSTRRSTRPCAARSPPSSPRPSGDGAGEGDRGAGLPRAGRTTKGGVQLARGVPVHETEARKDPRAPSTRGTSRPCSKS
ncbi:four-carbon acid sugar kinase family protein [Rubrobacter marinus]|uniref:four-carbon acid sugar kinase family protein n=1 Tax=Rubrobacter marinus TaxID=2653852 RepID=UPI00389B2EF7